MHGFASTTEIALALAIVAIGAALQGSVGFGFALLSAPFLEWINPRLVPGPLVLAVTVLLVLTALRERQSIDLRGIGWVLAGRVPGTLIGAVALAGLSESALTVTLGVLVLTAVGLSLLDVHLPRKPPFLVVAGVISGVMGTTAALGGPAVAILYQHERPELVRSTLATFFLIGALMSLPALAWVGRLGAEEGKLALLLLPGILLGFAVSARTARLLHGGRTRAAVLLVAGLAGATGVVRGLL
ncbi:MAG TPA: sulfite exporter TauE/SafE family protein [Polyangiaceae bacterium]